MRLLLKPTFAGLQSEYDENDFADEEQYAEELLFRQGFEGDVITVEDGEQFEVPEGMCATILEDENDNEDEEDGNELDINDIFDEEYKLYVVIADDVWEEESILDDLQSGLYQLDGHLIKEIELYE